MIKGRQEERFLLVCTQRFSNVFIAIRGTSQDRQNDRDEEDTQRGCHRENDETGEKQLSRSYASPRQELVMTYNKSL